MGYSKHADPSAGSTRAAVDTDEQSAKPSALLADGRSHAHLDKTLHAMLLTNLFSSTTHTRPVDKANATRSRLLALASIPDDSASLSSHPAKVRTGLLKARAKRQEAQREEKNAAEGWVRGPGPKRAKVGETRLRTGREARKKGMDSLGSSRSRGLGGGVGKFKDGMLVLSERDVKRVEGRSGRVRR